jgi:G3E family GTPase
LIYYQAPLLRSKILLRIKQSGYIEEWVSNSSLKKEKPEDVHTLSLESNGLIKTEDIKKFISETGSQLMRVKGFFENKEGTFFIEYIGDELAIRPFHKNIGRNNKIVLIGARMEESLLKEKFNKITSEEI